MIATTTKARSKRPGQPRPAIVYNVLVRCDDGHRLVYCGETEKEAKAFIEGWNNREQDRIAELWKASADTFTVVVVQPADDFSPIDPSDTPGPQSWRQAVIEIRRTTREGATAFSRGFNSCSLLRHGARSSFWAVPFPSNQLPLEGFEQ